MKALARVTVTLPQEMVRTIDAVTNNRSRFIVDAVERELQRRRRAELRRSLAEPHPEAAELAEVDFDAWAEGLSADDTSDLVDRQRGTAVQWVAGQGWRTPGAKRRKDR